MYKSTKQMYYVDETAVPPTITLETVVVVEDEAYTSHKFDTVDYFINGKEVRERQLFTDFQAARDHAIHYVLMELERATEEAERAALKAKQCKMKLHALFSSQYHTGPLMQEACQRLT